MRPHKFSRFWPCEVRFRTGYCGGIAALINDIYQCQRCHAEWFQDGTQHPNSHPQERTIV
jgi:hypothetical protein